MQSRVVNRSVGIADKSIGDTFLSTGASIGDTFLMRYQYGCWRYFFASFWLYSIPILLSSGALVKSLNNRQPETKGKN